MIDLSSGDLRAIGEILLRIALSCVFGGAIGYEREATNRPAGLRTHILVCVGSALTMMTGIFMFYESGGVSDPTRLGAQVISGIGFLGAGTIMREGLNVRGLTTAASLWAVSCVGLAIGAGYYLAALFAAMTILITLIFFKLIVWKVWSSNAFKTIVITATSPGDIMTDVSALFSDRGIAVKNIEFLSGDDGQKQVKIQTKMPNCSIPDLRDAIEGIVGVDRAAIRDCRSADAEEKR